MTTQLAGADRPAMLVRVRGVVQGVGFRPFVHRLASRHALSGWVRNRENGVEIVVAGDPESLEAFVRELRADAPPLAQIAELETAPYDAGGASSFTIVASAESADDRQAVAPDVTTCDACIRELRDPTNRRFNYPFITCTDCGPRYTVIDRMPYDRERTSMRAFTQCDACRLEYETPGDRRHHSETNSCAACGPRLTLLDATGTLERGEPCLGAAARLLESGAIVALRGLGGFHLAVDATDDEAVVRLRQRKHRDAKPLAVMVRSLEDARAIADMSDAEVRLVASRERPIVVAPRRPGSSLAPSVAPGMATVGIMLPYTPLHHLLLEMVGVPLVMTSGNLSDEPICASQDEALQRLTGITDAFLMHDREIVSRVDDSVMQVAGGAPLFLRRARGFAPLPVPLPVAAPAGTHILAVGAHLKNTITLAADQAAYVSPHVGDLDSLETLLHFRATVDRLADLFRIDPNVVARDLHPAYLSTKEAEQRAADRRIVVQHHHAHIAAVCAEHGVTYRVVGVAYDGTGFGDDGTAWGAEILVADLLAYERVAHLRSAPLPGSDLAVRTPWRSALGYLSLEPLRDAAFVRAFEGVDERELSLARRQIQRGVNTPLASSMGRLFDAAAAVLGVRRLAHFEGQAAMELETLAGSHGRRPLPFPVFESAGRLVMDPLPLLAELGNRVSYGESVESLAGAFHDAVVTTTADVVTRVCEDRGIDTVALGGGTFQNARLVGGLVKELESSGLRVLVPRALPPNDGAISYGQAAVAAARLAQHLS
ncbi:MAG TPA: carbamoyltransferase HypF [Gemmatimonadaceae bacterium]|nr:carbamoyltransferase HypF [Gemmatimonadaceae bacterium]